MVGEGVGDGEGEGVGVGVGVGVAVGVGVGVGVNCAWADDATPMASTKTTAKSRANARPAPIFSAHDAQRMNLIPEKAPARKKCATSRSARFDLRSVHAERQSVTVLTKD
jgi:hypothetical protein